MSGVTVSPSNQINRAESRHRLAFYITLSLGVLASIGSFTVWKTGNDAQKAIQDDADTRITAASTKASAAHDRADVSDKELRDLKHRQDNRVLTSAQSATIRDTLLTFPVRQVQVSCAEDSEEAYSYAKQLSRTLESAHWKTGAQTMRGSKYMVAAFGVGIVYREEDHVAAMELAGALMKGGIDPILMESTLPLRGFVQLYVGQK